MFAHYANNFETASLNVNFSTGFYQNLVTFKARALKFLLSKHFGNFETGLERCYCAYKSYHKSVTDNHFTD